MLISSLTSVKAGIRQSWPRIWPKTHGIDINRIVEHNKMPLEQLCDGYLPRRWYSKWERTMNKGDLIDTVQRELKGSHAASGRAVDAVLNAISRGLKRDGMVSLASFGTLTRRSRKSRSGTIPSSGKSTRFPSTKTVSFRPSPILRDML